MCVVVGPAVAPHQVQIPPSIHQPPTRVAAAADAVISQTIIMVHAIPADQTQVVQIVIPVIPFSFLAHQAMI